MYAAYDVITENLLMAYTMCEVEYWVILLGSGKVLTKGHEYVFSQGELLALSYIPQMSVRVDGPCTVGRVRYGDKEISSIIHNSILQIDPLHSANFRQIFLLALDLQSSQLPDKARLFELLDLTIYELASQTIRPALDQKLNPEVVRILNLIGENLSDCTFDLAEAIGQTNYNAAYFRQIFRQQVGHSPTEHLIGHRIARAKELLRSQEGDMPVSQLAARCGFADPSYFTRQFRQLEGMTPTRFRLAVLEEQKHM